MLALYVRLQNWLRSDEGQDLIEYVLIVALMVVIAIVGLSVAGSQIGNFWNSLGGWISNVAVNAKW